MKKAESYPIPDSLEIQWLALSLVLGLGYRSIQRLLDSGKTLADMLQATPGALIWDLGIKAELARKISSAAHASGYLMEKRLLQESPEIRLYCPESEAYPLQLKEKRVRPVFCTGKESKVWLNNPALPLSVLVHATATD